MKQNSQSLNSQSLNSQSLNSQSLNPAIVEQTELQQAVSTPQTPPKKTWAEHLSFLISLSIVGGIISLVGILWFNAEGKKPAHPVIQVKQEEIFNQSGQYYVPFEITNEGDETATQIQIVGGLKIGGTIEASGAQTIDFLARKESGQGVFVFQSDPRQGDLIIRVTNYQKP